MKDIYVLSYFSKESLMRFRTQKPFVVPINGFYRGVKINDCKVVEFSKDQSIIEDKIDQIAVMRITVLGIEKNQIVGKLNTLKYF